MLTFRSRWAALAAAGVSIAATSAHGASIYSSNVIATTSPTIYWDLEELSGTTTNDLAVIGGVNNGTYFDLHAPTLTQGALGPQPGEGFLAMTPDASTPVANHAMGVTHQGTNGVGYSSLATTAGVSTAQYSMAAWFIGDTSSFSNQNISYMLSRGNDNTSFRDSVGVGGSGYAPGKLLFFDGTNIHETAQDVSPNVWHQAVFVRDDTLATDKVKIYLDGDLWVTGNTAWGGGTGDFFTAGSRADYGNPAQEVCCGLEGRTDEVMLWNKSLTALEVDALYASATVPEPSMWCAGLAGLLGLATRRRRSHADSI